MFIVTGIIKLGAESIDQISSAAILMAEATRKEEGGLAYSFYQDIEHPGRFGIYEERQDDKALAAHFTMPHMAEFQDKLRQAEIKSMKIVKFEPGQIDTLV